MEDLHSLLDMRGGPSIFVWEVRCKSSRTFRLRLTDLWSGDFSSFLQPSTQTSIFLACEFLHPLSSGFEHEEKGDFATSPKHFRVAWVKLMTVCVQDYNKMVQLHLFVDFEIETRGLFVRE